MASLRKLNRRLLAWERYASKTGMPTASDPVWLSWAPPLPGHRRAWAALDIELDRRFWADDYEPGRPVETATVVGELL